ncbi:DHA2 family efflux MFS transporter permease subunit [Aquisalimonas sp.]|uniref:DHA2 family efflux MFS transporter permease subunit n=1 Tax=Aquisalimonas sp. TaxID=1872621 RepID=UPI0025C4CF95|nr:DHA2 family efflux MFS transporter permease subunit [Aquisalimonas sp.]
MTSETERLYERFGPAYKWLATATVMLGTLSMTLATTIVNVAIPDIMGVFGMDQSQAQWLATGFLAAMTAFMLLSAWALSAFGMRAAYIGAMVVFIGSALAGGLSVNEDMVILSRVVQGAMAGIIQPLAMTIIFQVFPARQRGLGMGIYGLGVILGPAIGPVLGGVLVDLFSWRAVFFLPLPTCLLGIVFAVLFLAGRESRGPRPGFDWFGFALLSAFLLCLLWATSNGQRLGWNSLLIQGLFVAAAVALVGFVLWQLRSSEPLLNVRIFAVPGFAAGSMIGFCFGAALFGSTYLIPLFVQEIQQFTATKAGLLLMPAGLVMAMSFPLAGHLSDRLPPHVPIAVGLVLIAVSCFALGTADVNTAFWVMVFWITLGRIGLGLGLPSINTGSLRTLDFSLVSQGAGAVNFSRQLGGALGVNALSVLLDRRTWFHTEVMAQTQTAANPMTRELLMRFQELAGRLGVSPDRLEPEALRFLGEMVFRQGYARGFQDSFLALGVVFLLALIPAWLMGRYTRQ